MTDARGISVQRYLDACEVLRHEIRLSMDDIEDRSEHDIEIHYLVDFSEIFSFAFPQETIDPLHLFGDEDRLAMELLQRDALNNLFFRTLSPAVILPPYAIELQSQLAKLRVGYFDELIRKMEEALRAIERAVATKEVRDLLEDLQRVKELTPEQLQNAFTVFEKHATPLLLLHQHTDETPYQKIAKLVNRGRIVPLQGRLMEIEPHTATRDRWFTRIFRDRLDVLRPDLARDRRNEIEERSYLDATAMGLLYALNHDTDEKVRFLFVTRSTHMHRMFDEELAKGLWQCDVFRHPRSFSSLFLRHDSAADGNDAVTEQALRKLWSDRHEQLRGYFESMDLFIEMTRPRLLANEPIDSDPQFIQQVRQIRDDWELSGVLATSPTEAREAQTIERRRRVMDIVELLTEREAFTRLVDKRLTQLIDDLERGQAFAGFYAQSNSATERNTLRNDVRAQMADTDQAILTCRRYWVPHTLEFNTPELKNWAKDLQEKSDITWRDISDFLRQNFSRQAEYERQLAMAYLLASLKKWHFAERFCIRALNVDQMREPQAETLRYEGHFFLAVCLRMHNPTLDRYSEGLRHLDKASSLRLVRSGFKLSVDSTTHDDPRYLIERGNHIYKWNQLAHAARGAKPQPPSAIGASLELWQQALVLAAGRPLLAAQIHNNICFYYCDATRSPNARKVREHLTHMIEQQGLAEKDRRRWPPVYIDTIAVARHLLFKQSGNPADRAALVEATVDLDWTIENAELLLVHKEGFKHHLMAINGTLKTRGAVPQASSMPSAD